MTNINTKKNHELATKFEVEYAQLRDDLMNATINAFRKNHMERDGFLGNGYDSGVEAAMERIAQDWPKDWAWYIYKGMIYPTWINRVTGENAIQSEIDWWNKD